MKRILTLTALMLFFSVTLQGCQSHSNGIPAAAEGKNIGIDGYVMYGTLDTADGSTGTPAGKLIVGRMVYKSRKVGIPADQKVPNTGNFKSIRTKSLFGTEEHIVEYDFTAGNESEAAAASQRLEKIRVELLPASQSTRN